MESITYPAQNGQGVESEKVAVEVLPHGCKVAYLKPRLRGSQLDRVKRGNIVSFSRGARRRLRDALLRLSIPNSLVFGVTFTVPWKSRDFSLLIDEFRECWNRFGSSFRFRFPNSGMIYRVELQQRGAPHIHAIFSIANCDCHFSGGAPAQVRGVSSLEVAKLFAGIDLPLLWQKSVKDLHHGSINAFLKRGVKVEPIPDIGSMYRYMADHASKSKQAQLGYQGKQWGVLGRRNYRSIPADTLPDFESDAHLARFLRVLRKIMRYRVTSRKRRRPWKRPPPFGSVLRGSRRTFGHFYLRGDLVRKIWEVTK